MAKIITLLTDFGYKDHYVAAMKGVILSICPDALIVDVTHGIRKFDVRSAAYVLRGAARYFPPGSIHVVVVDPGVGTERRGIVVKTKNYLFVGPDNGVIALAALKDGVEEIRVIENRELMLSEVTPTFHGRDVFAPVAAHLAKGLPLEKVGRKAEEFIVPEYARPRVRNGLIECEVIYVDDFGNAALNVDRELLEKLGINYGDEADVLIASRKLHLKLLPSYGYVDEGEPLLVINSEGFLEISVNRGSAASILGIKPGTKVVMRFT